MRLLRYDTLRVLATVAVVWLHVSMYAVLYNDPLSFEWWVGNVADAAVRWCVPVFVLVSGALLLGPRPEAPRDFYRKRLNRILIPLLFWSAFYTGLKLAAGAVTPAEAADGLWQGRPHYHLWYLYMALGLYLSTPILRSLLEKLSARRRVAITLLLLAVSIGGTAAAFFANYKGSFFTLFAPYVGYYVLGYHLARSPLALHTGILWTLLLGSIAATAIGAAQFGLYAYTYVGVPVLVMSTAVYSLGLKLPLSVEGSSPLLGRGITLLAEASLGIYLVHPLFLELAERTFGMSVYCRYPLLSIPAFTALAFAASGTLVLVLLRLPYLRRIVGASP